MNTQQNNQQKRKMMKRIRCGWFKAPLSKVTLKDTGIISSNSVAASGLASLLNAVLK